LTEEERVAAWTARLIITAVVLLAAMYAAIPADPPSLSDSLTGRTVTDGARR
jgi:hypothetical protein